MHARVGGVWYVRAIPYGAQLQSVAGNDTLMLPWLYSSSVLSCS